MDKIDKIYSSNLFDLLIINDGSKNKIYLKKIKSKFKIDVINLKKNYGVGFCTKLALNYAHSLNYTKLCRIDADGEHDPFFIKEIFFNLKKKDFVFCKRLIKEKQNLFKYISKSIIMYLINNMFNYKVQDYNCGMMGFGKKAIQIFKNNNFLKYPEPEIILNVLSSKLKYFVIPITQLQRLQGKSSINFIKGLDYFLTVIFLIINYKLNKKF